MSIGVADQCRIRGAGRPREAGPDTVGGPELERHGKKPGLERKRWQVLPGVPSSQMSTHLQDSLDMPRISLPPEFICAPVHDPPQYHDASSDLLALGRECP